MATTYDVGDVVRMTGTFAQNGTATDPSTVAIQIRTPVGAVVTYTYGTDAEVVKSSTGVFYADYTVTGSGQHWYRWVSTGTGAAAEEGHFEVRPTKVLRQP